MNVLLIFNDFFEFLLIFFYVFSQLLNEITDTSQIKKENPIFDIADVECKPVTSQGLVDMV